MMLFLFLPDHGQHVVHHPAEQLHDLISGESQVCKREKGMELV